eukprot:68644_1
MFTVREEQLETLYSKIQNVLKEAEDIKNISNAIKKESKISNPINSTEQATMQNNLQLILLLQNSKNWRSKCIQHLLSNLLTPNITINDISNDTSKILSEEKQYWQTYAVIITSIIIKTNPTFPLSIGQCIVSYLESQIKICYPKHHSVLDYIKYDIHNASIIIESTDGNEKNIILSNPKLLGSHNVPYKLSFNLEFLKTTTAGYHAGVHWGSNNINHNRWSGHKRLEQGAVTSVIDCYMNRPSWRVYGVSGRGPDAQINETRSFKQMNGKKWEIVFDKNNKCKFLHDGREICANFTAVGVGGYIGFWVYKSGSIKVYNICVEENI